MEATEGPRDSKRIKQTHNEPSGKPILIKDISNEWDAKLKPYAQTALLYYNERMGTSFTLEKVVDCYAHGEYMHMNFMGKSPRRLFFAELSPLDDVVVTTCTIVEPDNPLFRVGCGICHPCGLVYHPPSSYLGGRFQYPGAHTVSRDLEQRKKEFENLYEGSSEVKELDEHDLQELKQKATVFAEKGLKNYNRLHYYGDFEFSELTGIVRFVDETRWNFGHWLHLNFKAINNHPESDRATKIFFAEVRLRDEEDDLSVRNCCIMDATKTDGKIREGCGVCTKLYHLTRGHSAGIEGTVLAAWEPTRSLIRKYEWSLLGGGSMDVNSIQGDSAGSISTSLDEQGKLHHVAKDTKDQHGKLHHVVKDTMYLLTPDQVLHKTNVSYLFGNLGGPDVSMKLATLSFHYGAIYSEKESKLTSTQCLAQAKKFDEMVNFILSRPKFDGVELEKKDLIAGYTGLKSLHDSSISHVTAMTVRFIADLSGLAPNDIVQNISSLLDHLFLEGVKMISDFCFSAVCRLLMLGRAIVYNAKKSAGEPFEIGFEIDKDILAITWPGDCIGKARIIKESAKEMYGYLEGVSNSFSLAMSNVARKCVEASKDAGNSEECIRKELRRYTEDLQKNKMMAVAEINRALRRLAFLSTYTSLDCA